MILRQILCVVLLLCVSHGARAQTETPTDVPATATNTPVPATATETPTDVPATATNTPVPATATNTPVPATATNTPVPATATNTPVPATATRTPTVPTGTPSLTATETPTVTQTPSWTATDTYTPSVTPTPIGLDRRGNPFVSMKDLACPTQPCCGNWIPTDNEPFGQRKTISCSCGAGSACTMQAYAQPHSGYWAGTPIPVQTPLACPDSKGFSETYEQVQMCITKSGCTCSGYVDRLPDAVAPVAP